MPAATMYFPPDFRWGTATSAYQVEGHNHNSDWWPWEQTPGHIRHDQKSGAAANWWQDVTQDLDQAQAMGTNAHRLSIEWSRIEPEPSVFDKDNLQRYRAILQAMHDRGIEPMVTLHHFSNPIWLREKGDFNSNLVVDYFQRYVAKVVDELGDLVSHWVTINEPMVYIFSRYLADLYPAPARSGWAGAAEALRNLLRCHAAAYHTIKDAQPAAQVGFAKNILILTPRPNGSFLDRWWAGRLDWLFNDLWTACVSDGRLRWPLGRGQIEGLRDSFDFFGLNYYTRFLVRFPKLLDRTWAPDAVVSDGDYGEVYPEGIFQALKKANRYGKPIFITENGLPDEDDDLRPGFIVSHLREVWRAISFCYPVMGYYHWSLVDNFEWAEGWTQRFGLLQLDRDSGARRLRPSGELYGEICRSGTLSSDMVKRYAPALFDRLFPGYS